MSTLKTVQRGSKGASFFKIRAKAWLKLDEYDLAVRSYYQAIKLDPECVDTHVDLAWLFATCPDDKIRDGQQAVKFAQYAYFLDDENPKVTETLAAAHAEAGNFEEAVRWRTESLKSDFPQPHSSLNPIILMDVKND